MNILTKVGLTALTVVLAIPGLVIEPGPFSEIIAVAVISGIWGFDVEIPGGGK